MKTEARSELEEDTDGQEGEAVAENQFMWTRKRRRR